MNILNRAIRYIFSEVSATVSKADSMAASNKEGALGYLNHALENTEVRVSLFGSRYVTSTDNRGSVSLYKVTETANKIFDEYRRAWKFSEEERKTIKAIEQKIDSFYKKSDELIKSSNIFTKFLNGIKEFSFNPYSD